MEVDQAAADEVAVPGTPRAKEEGDATRTRAAVTAADGSEVSVTVRKADPTLNRIAELDRKTKKKKEVVEERKQILSKYNIVDCGGAGSCGYNAISCGLKIAKGEGDVETITQMQFTMAECCGWMRLSSAGKTLIGKRPGLRTTRGLRRWKMDRPRSHGKSFLRLFRDRRGGSVATPLMR